jgi:hypothetical protein
VINQGEQVPQGTHAGQQHKRRSKKRHISLYRYIRYSTAQIMHGAVPWGLMKAGASLETFSMLVSPLMPFSVTLPFTGMISS